MQTLFGKINFIVCKIFSRTVPSAIKMSELEDQDGYFTSANIMEQVEISILAIEARVLDDKFVVFKTTKSKFCRLKSPKF